MKNTCCEYSLYTKMLTAMTVLARCCLPSNGRQERQSFQAVTIIIPSEMREGLALGQWAIVRRGLKEGIEWRILGDRGAELGEITERRHASPRRLGAAPDMRKCGGDITWDDNNRHIHRPEDIWHRERHEWAYIDQKKMKLATWYSVRYIKLLTWYILIMHIVEAIATRTVSLQTTTKFVKLNAIQRG